MYIRKVIKQNKGSSQKYTEYRLVRSQRVGKKVSQHTIITMQEINLPKYQWPDLAVAIEARIRGQQILFIEPDVQKEAERWYNAFVNTKARKSVVIIGEKTDYENISISSVANHHPRTIGAEYIALKMFLELGFEDIFRSLGFPQSQIDEAALSIIGRVVEPGSENATAKWARTQTGLDTLLNTDFSKLSHNALYRITDTIYKNKEYIERQLRQKECTIFNLKESIILYDLTNTYLEGMAKGIPKAKFGYSKEKRYDCRLLTLGLVIDELGFPKRSKVMEGSISECKTLKQMLTYLRDPQETKPITVVIDAGISSEENLQYLREHGYDYLCVARNKPIDYEQIDTSQFVAIPNKGKTDIYSQIFKTEKESILYCQSAKMEEKEKAIQEKFCSRFEAELEKINNSLTTKHGKRKYSYVQERVIRLKERFKSVSAFYTINILQDNDKATEIIYNCEFQDKLDVKYSGSYYLRTSHLNLSNDEIWSIYMMLNAIESAFRTMKSELQLRPISHQKGERVEAHLFITVLAYHIVNAIRHRLKENDINSSWNTIRKIMRNHLIIQTSMQNKKGETITILNITTPEDIHLEIYEALNLNPNPIPRKVSKLKLM